MPKLNEMFPSKWLKADDFDEDGTVLTVKKLKEESVGQGRDADEKWVLYFEELEKGLVLNKTNTNIIAKLYGDDTDEWKGKLVTLYATDVQYKDEMVSAIRVKTKVPKPRKAAAAAGKPTAPAQNDGDDDADGDDETPF